MTTGGAILAADFGSVHTRVVLVDVVDGTYQVIAHQQERTTNRYPHNNVSVGLTRAIRELEALTGRKLLDPGDAVMKPEDPALRQGVDFFVTTASAGRPLRAVMVGLMPDISLSSGLRAIAGAYIDPVANIHLRDGCDDEERLNAILLNQPDLIFITGGTDRGARGPMMPLLEIVALALQLIETDQRPAIIFAGNRRLRATVEALFDDLAPYLIIADNIRPAINEEHIEAVKPEVARVYDQYRETGGMGFGKVGAMSDTGILPSAQSYTLMAEYLAKTRKGNLLIADVGSTASVLVGNFRGEVTTYISTGVGLGTSAEQLLQNCGEAAINAWLPFYTRPGELVNYSLNKTLQPASIPLSQRELYLEHGFLKAGMQLLVSEASSSWMGVKADEPLPTIDTIIIAGSALTETGSGTFSMLLVADGLQPTGITRIKADPHGLVTALGGIARQSAEAVVQMIEGPALETVGTLISVDGYPQKDRPAIFLRITTDSGERVNQTIMGGQVLALPLPVGYKLKVRIRTARGLRIGGRRRQTVTLEGGTGGLLFDARGRKLVVGNTPEERAEAFPQWLAEVTETEIMPIPDRWLVPPDAPELELAEADVNNSDAFFDLASGDEIVQDIDELFADLDDEDDDLLDPIDKKEDEEDELGSLRDLL